MEKEYTNLLKEQPKDHSTKDKDEFISCVIFDPAGRPLRFTRNRQQKLDPGKYDFLSGHMTEKSETPIHALIREITEEVGMKREDIAEIYDLKRGKTPHKKFANHTCHFYCLITNLSEEQINEAIQKVAHPELEKAEFLDSIEVLENQMRIGENWRSQYTEDARIKLNMMKQIIEQRKQLEEKYQTKQQEQER